jgi:hypothetical protein
MWACLGFMFVNSEPTIRVRNWFYKSMFKSKDFTSTWHWRLLNCCLCISTHIYFWYQLFFFQNIDILGAVAVGVIAEFINNKLNSGSL